MGNYGGMRKNREGCTSSFRFSYATYETVVVEGFELPLADTDVYVRLLEPSSATRQWRCN